MDDVASPRLSRREIAKFAAIGWLLAGSPLRAALATTESARRPVVGFFNDAPLLDLSGRDTAYSPPSRAHASAPDCESLMRQGYFL